MPTLGQELTRLRTLRGWSLRDVEEKTEKTVSNSYLNQLENDNVRQPSPNVLFRLARVYSASYPGLLRLAGYVVPSSDPNASQTQTSVAFNSLDLSEKEMHEVMDFIEFMRRKKKSARK